MRWLTSDAGITALVLGFAMLLPGICGSWFASWVVAMAIGVFLLMVAGLWGLWHLWRFVFHDRHPET
ncbi:hypothetical protein [Sulfobacillus sp. hq2]|uniref:hypothetical protein n=1 Tax=Sulfobacillus sp. hq2 TaxID=2039167 RepID=UPI000CCFF223|nr:hypothetical protein [Sulfobacillus sp. hq2]POB12219.1 hypothetical protein CO251_00905 [Sulfobacillus sp. hq2]